MDIIYNHADPCLDGYYSATSQKIIFGARRIGPTGLISGAMTCSFSPMPSNQILGSELLNQLEKAKEILKIDDPLLSKIITKKYSASNILGFDLFSDLYSNESEYGSFTLWTKNDQTVPYFVGVPASDRFPLFTNSRPITNPSTPEFFGSEFRNFLTDFMG